MAGDQNSFRFPGGAAFSSPVSRPLHHCHSTAQLYSSQPIPGDGPALLAPGAMALSSLGAFQNELLSERPYVLPESSVDCRDSYSLEWGVPSYSASALINGYPATSNVRPSTLLADVAGLSPFVEGALQCDSTADPLSSSYGSSSLPAETAGFPPFEEGALAGASTAGQFNGLLLSSGGAGAANFYPSCYQETPPYSSSATLTVSPVISGSGAAAAAFCPSPKQEPFYYSSTMPLIENPPAISGNEPMVTSMGVAAVAGPSQAEPSGRNGLNISLIWTPEEQRQLNELCRSRTSTGPPLVHWINFSWVVSTLIQWPKGSGTSPPHGPNIFPLQCYLCRYGHIECNVARLAKIARPFHGKSIRDVALRIRWMEEKSSQQMKVVNSLRSHRAMRIPGRSRDYSSNPSSQPGIPY